MALALPGFQSGWRVRGEVEAAGISYEVNSIRDRVLFGDLNISGVPRSCLKKLWAFWTLRENSQEMSSDDSESGEDSDSDDSGDDASCELTIGEWMEADDEAFKKYLRSLDPVSWKDQDHYKVLGLSKLRHAASKNQIKAAYRKKVLEHHPDKRKNSGVPVSGDDYYACITKAYETLGSVHKRRAFDSVDPLFDEAIPAASQVTASDFFTLFRPVFQRNSRWSRKKPVPKLGDEETDMSEVDSFYSFWFEFPSWREFSYLDEEDKEKGECREERRWMEKQNKAARDKKRKEEMKRIRSLVEMAYQNDPRIINYREEEKRKKEAFKLAKKEEKRLQREREENERREREEVEKGRLEEEEARKKKEREDMKREKDAKKKALQRQRKLLAEKCKESNYFAGTAEERLKNMEDVDRLSRLLEVEDLEKLNADLREHNGLSHAQLFRKRVEELDEVLEAERAKARAELEESKKGGGGSSKGSRQARWTEEEVQLLVKAATLFPVGTKSRWEVVAEFINEHRKEDSDSSKKTSKDVIAKAKELQSSDASGKESVGVGKAGLVAPKKEGATERLPPPTQRTECPAEMLGEVVWSSEEQKLLEQALRTYPGSTPDRWERIAESVPGKSKKECMKRFKELAELVRAKKAAQEKVAASGKSS